MPFGPITTASVSGVASKSANYTALATDDLVLATAGSGGITVTTPPHALGKRFEVKKVDTGAGYVTLSAASGTIDEVGVYVLTAPQESVTLVSDGTSKWHVVMAYRPPSQLFDTPAVGEFTMPRQGILQSSVSTASGRLNLVFFTAKKTESISQVTILSGSAAAATATLCRIGVYAIDAATSAGTLVASTPNDTTLFGTTFTTYNKTFSAPFIKVAGRRYALGILIVASSTPNYYGNANIPQSASGAGAKVAPYVAGTIAGQADLPASFADASVGHSGAVAIAGLILP